jgi:hypothetical protein
VLGEAERLLVMLGLEEDESVGRVERVDEEVVVEDGVGSALEGLEEDVEVAEGEPGRREAEVQNVPGARDAVGHCEDVTVRVVQADVEWEPVGLLLREACEPVGVSVAKPDIELAMLPVALVVTERVSVVDRLEHGEEEKDGEAVPLKEGGAELVKEAVEETDSVPDVVPEVLGDAVPFTENERLDVPEALMQRVAV